MAKGESEYRPQFAYMQAFTDTHLAAIGRVASNWSRVEQTLAMALWADGFAPTTVIRSCANDPRSDRRAMTLRRPGSARTSAQSGG